MMPREEGGVVDSRLNVYGVEGLKVAGMSLVVIVRALFFPAHLFDYQICPSLRTTWGL